MDEDQKSRRRLGEGSRDEANRAPDLERSAGSRVPVPTELVGTSQVWTRAATKSNCRVHGGILRIGGVVKLS